MKLDELVHRGGMTEVQAIRDGKVVEQYIGRVPGSDSDA